MSVKLRKHKRWHGKIAVAKKHVDKINYNLTHPHHMIYFKAKAKRRNRYYA